MPTISDFSAVSAISSALGLHAVVFQCVLRPLALM